MYNSKMLGIRHGEQINLKIVFFVIALFTLITIISYINELSKAGYLDATKYKNKHLSREQNRKKRTVDSKSSALIHSNGNIHQLGLELSRLKKTLKSRDVEDNHEQGFNMVVRLDRKESYTRANRSKFHVYKHSNTLPNFFVNGSESYVKLNQRHLKSQGSVRALLKAKHGKYRKATKVFLYQHEPGGYFARECFKKMAAAEFLHVAQSPLTASSREEWNILSQRTRDSFDVLYGGLSFGVCDRISHPCSYFTFLQNPVERIVTVFEHCQRNASHPFCGVNHLINKKTTFAKFVKNQGNNLFHKLLYYNRHCRLVGDDEICLPDSKTSFLLNSEEKKAHLQNILDNLGNWFGVVGLLSYLPESLVLFEKALGLEFTSCLTNRFTARSKQFLGLSSHQFNVLNICDRRNTSSLNISRESHGMNINTTLHHQLVSNKTLMQWIRTDVAIYEKFSEIFHKQLDSFCSSNTLKIPKTHNKKVKLKKQHKIKDHHHDPHKKVTATKTKKQPVSKSHDVVTHKILDKQES